MTPSVVGASTTGHVCGGFTVTARLERRAHLAARSARARAGPADQAGAMDGADERAPSTSAALAAR